MPSFLPGLSQWLQHRELPYGVLVFPWFVWYELKASEARQVKRIEELQADMKESSAQARNAVKASEARQEKRIDELRADLKTSEARQREDVADLKADDRALKRGSGPDGMPAPPATPPVTVNISMQPSPTRGIAGQPSKPATASTHPPIERAVSVCETAPPASAGGGAAKPAAPETEKRPTTGALPLRMAPPLPPCPPEKAVTITGQASPAGIGRLRVTAADAADMWAWRYSPEAVACPLESRPDLEAEAAWINDHLDAEGGWEWMNSEEGRMWMDAEDARH